MSKKRRKSPKKTRNSGPPLPYQSLIKSVEGGSEPCFRVLIGEITCFRFKKPRAALHDPLTHECEPKILARKKWFKTRILGFFLKLGNRENRQIWPPISATFSDFSGCSGGIALVEGTVVPSFRNSSSLPRSWNYREFKRGRISGLLGRFPESGVFGGVHFRRFWGNLVGLFARAPPCLCGLAPDRAAYKTDRLSSSSVPSSVFCLTVCWPRHAAFWI